MKLEEKHMEELGFKLGTEGFYDHTEIPRFFVLFHDNGIAASLRKVSHRIDTYEALKQLVQLAKRHYAC